MSRRPRCSARFRPHPWRAGVWALVAAAGLAALAPGGEPEGEKNARAPEPEPYSAALIPIAGVIDTALATSVERRLEEAVDDGHTLLVLHITSGGGFLDDGMEMSRAVERLGRRGTRTVAYVDAKAYSAAAILAFSCQEIVMTPESSIGACTPYMAGLSGPVEMEDPVRAKMEGAVIERMETLADAHGYPKALLKAMVKMETVVVEITNTETDERRYIEEEDLFSHGPEWTRTETVDQADEVLTVGGEDAETYGIAAHTADRLDDLYDLYPLAERLDVYPVTASETVVAWLNSVYLKSLLVLVGLMGLYIELNTPGFGVPGAVGIGAFAMVFAASFLAGNPDWLPPGLFLLGLVMLGIEVFVTPGFGVLGSLGALAMLGAIVLGLAGFRYLPERSFEWDELVGALAMTGIVLIAFVAGAFVVGRFLPRMPLLGHIVLGESEVSDGSSRAAAARQESAARVGEVGRLATQLRPAGKARFGDRLVDVVTEGDLLEAGITVEVVRVRGNRIVVKPAAGADETPGSET